MCVGENNRKHGQSTSIFYITERKARYRYFFSMRDEESRSARKRMWKITSDIFVVFLLRIALKRPNNK